jgi:hypothetical protein
MPESTEPSYTVTCSHREFAEMVTSDVVYRTANDLKFVSYLLWGMFGAGKTLLTGTVLVDALSAATGHQYAVNTQFRASNVESIDLRGLPDIRGKFVEWIQAGFLPDADRDGEYGVLIIDEIFLNAMVIGVLMELCGERGIGGYKLPPGWIIVGLSNRGSDRSGVTRGNSMAMDNRFEHFELEMNVPEFIRDYCIPNDWDPLHIAWMQYDHSVVHEFPNGSTAAEAKNRTAVATPRSHERFDFRIKQDLPARIERKAFAANLGAVLADSFIAFRELITHLPNVQEFWDDPAGVMIPTELDVQWALLGVMASQVDDVTFPALFTLLRRMDEEHVATVMPLVIKRNPDWKETATYRDYSLEYTHLNLIND